MPVINGNSAKQIAAQGALALSRLVQPDGRFIYRYRASVEPKPGRKYNVLRHCGAAWSMMEVARQLNVSEVMAAAERAINHISEHFVFPYEENQLLCVVDRGRIKLGGNGLALLALAEFLELKWDVGLAGVARKLASYIVSERLQNGDFVHSRIYATKKVRDFRSDYYTGEALFGLVRLYEVTAEHKWLDCAVGSAKELFKSNYGVSAQSHWMLYALERLYENTRLTWCIEHARRIAEHIVLFPEYRKTDRSTPIACRSEGLLAYIRLLRASTRSDISPTAKTCLQEVRRNLALQIKFRTPSGAFTRGGEIDEVRIDYIQHNISSFLAYYRLRQPFTDISNTARPGATNTRLLPNPTI